MPELNVADILQQLAWYKKYFKLKYYEPYPYQRKMHNAYGHGTNELATDRAIVAANKIGKCTLLSSTIDTPSGARKLGDIFGTECEVMAWDGQKNVPRRVLSWVQKPPADCYRFTMIDGSHFDCADKHFILSSRGAYREAHTFAPSLQASISAFCPSARVSSVLHWSQKRRDSIRRCLMDYRRYGARLLSDEGGVQVFAPSQVDAPRRTRLLWRLGALGDKLIGNLCEWLLRLSSYDALRQVEIRDAESPALISCSDGESCHDYSPIFQRLYVAAFSRLQSVGVTLFRQSQVPSFQPFLLDAANQVERITYIGKYPVYDLQVEELENYCAAGLVHHNTYGCAMEVAMHATGLYPDDWEGRRWSHRVEIMCGSESNELTRDVMQRELFGDPEDKESVGTGAVPRRYIGRITRKNGVPNAFDSVLVKHVAGGWSRVFFRAYEQGAKKHMGFHIHLGWMDEEPPRAIKSQYLRATLNTHGVLLTSFTPESGMTEICNEYFNDIKIGQSLTQATWDDCPLFDDAQYKESVLAQFPLHEREMRSKGIPQMGSGLVFTTPDEDLMIDAFEIPRHWPRIKAVDFGIDHPFASVAIAWDPDTDTAYLYWAHRKTRQKIAEDAAAINSFDEWIPVVWPHDGMQDDKESGKPLADIYRDPPYRVNMLPACFSNPPPPGKKEGQGGQGVEVGLLALDEAMNDGKFRVFSHLSDWFEEKRTYHRLDGKVIKVRDDLMAATRYAFLSKRFAEREIINVRRRPKARGMKNW